MQATTMPPKTMATPPTTAAPPFWLKAAGALGLVWNAYGVVQFIGSFAPTRDSLMRAGMSDAQAAVYLALPAWVSVVFAIGVFGGLVASVLLLLRRGAAVPVAAASLAGYVGLFAGDTYHGVFASMPSQLAILALVVLIAAGLLWTVLAARRRGWLR